MHMSDFFNNIFSSLKNIPFDTLILTVWGSFGAIFVLSLALCIFTTKIKTPLSVSGKRFYGGHVSGVFDR